MFAITAGELSGPDIPLVLIVQSHILQSQDCLDSTEDVAGQWFVGLRFHGEPLTHLTTDGNYREWRHFTAWARPREVEDYYLEQIVGKITGQYKVPFGDAVISTHDTCLGLETCEELFTPNGYVFLRPRLLLIV